MTTQDIGLAHPEHTHPPTRRAALGGEGRGQIINSRNKRREYLTEYMNVGRIIEGGMGFPFP